MRLLENVTTAIMTTAAIAIVTLVIGVVMFSIGIWGQIMLRSKKRLAHPGDRKSFNIVVTVLSIVVGVWLLILSAVYLLHHHHSPLHT